MPCGQRQLRQLIGTDAYSELTHGHGETRESQAGPASGARQFGASVRCVNPPHPLAHPRALGAARKRLAGEARKASKPVRKPPPRMCACARGWSTPATPPMVDRVIRRAADGRPGIVDCARDRTRLRRRTAGVRLARQGDQRPIRKLYGSRGCETSITARGTCILAGAPLYLRRRLRGRLTLYLTRNQDAPR